MLDSTSPLLGEEGPPQRRWSFRRRTTATSLEDAWSAREAEEAAGPEDYTSIIFNLHAWSYRLSQQEFSYYERRSQLRQAARSFDPRHLSLLFRAQEPPSPSPPAAAAATHTAAAAAAAAPAGPKPWRYVGFSRTLQRSGSSTRKTPKPHSWLGLPVLPVSHPAMAVWSALMLLLDMSYTAVLLPLLFAFGRMHPGAGVYWLSVGVGFLFLADMVVVMHRGVVVRYLDKHVYIDSPADVARLYLGHGSFLSDLPVALSGPLQLLALLPAGHAGHVEGSGINLLVNTAVMLRGLRLIKLLLLSRELFFGKMGFRHMGPSLYRWYGLSLVYVLGVLLHWLGCFMLGVARGEGLEGSWLADVKGHDLTAAPASQQYMAAFYWMLISTLTIGYGDISASTPLEQAAVVAAVITGVLFIGYAIKGITDIMAEAAVQDEYSQRITLLRQRAGELKVWAAWQDLPTALEEPMFRYFMGPWLTQQVVTRHWGNVLQDLPAQLRGQVLATLLVERHKELSPLGSRLLAGVPLTSRWHVLALLQPVALAPGQQLCWAGQAAEHIWLMQEGSVVSLDGVVPRLDSFNDTPGMLLAFDALAWLQLQRARLQQRQQQQQQAWLDAHAGNGTSSNREGDSSQAHPNMQQQQQQQGSPAAAAAAAAAAGGDRQGSHPSTRYVSTSSSTSRAATPITNPTSPTSPSMPSPSPSPSCDASLSAEPSQQYAAAAAASSSSTAAAAAAPRYTVSYQAVGSSFFWVLPLQQLGLAFSGSDGPRLLDNFEAELAAAGHR